MNDDGHDGDFASVVWDTPASEPSSAQRDQHGSSTGQGEGPSSGSLARRASRSGSAAPRDASEPQQHSNDGSGVRRSPSKERDVQNAGRYWIKLSAGEPTKMLEGTKDAYVSYLVKGEVCAGCLGAEVASRLK